MTVLGGNSDISQPLLSIQQQSRVGTASVLLRMRVVHLSFCSDVVGSIVCVVHNVCVGTSYSCSVMLRAVLLAVVALVMVAATVCRAEEAPNKADGCARYEFYCAASKGCIPAWACCGCDEKSASDSVRVAAAKSEYAAKQHTCPHLQFWCPNTNSCLPPWACCNC